ncbi:hypothetical protein HBB16_11940 [Pseudonocardia sp. MCCB 268]|nr:hypothetical protein [Pseudonocardia cytotoxica]
MVAVGWRSSRRGSWWRPTPAPPGLAGHRRRADPRPGLARTSPLRCVRWPRLRGGSLRDRPDRAGATPAATWTRGGSRWGPTAARAPSTRLTVSLPPQSTALQDGPVERRGTGEFAPGWISHCGQLGPRRRLPDVAGRAFSVDPARMTTTGPRPRSRRCWTCCCPEPAVAGAGPPGGGLVPGLRRGHPRARSRSGAGCQPGGRGGRYRGPLRRAVLA